ncbi:MAG: DUF4012 domain-containing protein [Candidatus Kerfeldbacteria bacterium]
MSNKKINNFLHPKSKKKSKYRKYKKIIVPITIVLGIIIFLSLILYLVYKDTATNIYRNSLDGKNNFYLAQEKIIEQDFDTASYALRDATNNFKEAHSEFEKVQWLKIIPWVGIQVNAIDNLLLAGISTGESLNVISDTARDIITPLQKNDDISLSTLSESETKELMKSIYDSKENLETAKKSIDIAVDYLENISKKGLLGKIKEVTTPLQENVPALQNSIDVAISASQILPSIGGYPEKKTYLFLLQNNTELRPTGGFIGTYGILKVINGDIDYFKTENVYNLDEPAKDWVYIEPPWPLTRYNAVYNWYLRDSNWSPDFPTAAKKAEEFYHLERGPEKDIDGVIAVTPTFIQSLLKLTGEITINGLTFTEENFIDTLQYQVDKGFLSIGLEESERKEIIGLLSKEILDRVLELPKSQWPDFWKVFEKDITEKQILIYVKDGYVQDFIEKENWGGTIKEVEHDYLSVIDANLASLKSDPGIKRTISYTVNRDGDNFIADLNINYKNEGTITWKTTRYRTYTRVYVPEGSNLLKSSGSMIDCKIDGENDISTEVELGKTVFGAFICIEPGEEGNLSYKYILPENISDNFKDDHYSLLVQKQPGAAGHVLNIELKLKKKPNIAISDKDIDIVPSNDIVINSLLSQDRLIKLEY